jgi:diaminopimelate epimerase
MKVEFYKYQGTGNDFIILDNRKGEYSVLNEKEVHGLCDRKFGIGADGLMLLGNADGYDFSMQYFNADGKEGSMCGNGGRCMVRFANDMGINKTTYKFIAVDGEHLASFNEKGNIKLKMQDVDGISSIGDDKVLNTGSPHYIKNVSGINELDVFNEGKKIRYSESYKQHGINVNFVEKDEDGLYLRTYERGVEDETLSCGTGATAAAIASTSSNGQHHVKVKVLGGKLEVEFERKNENQASNIWLIGPAVFVYKGEITIS